MSRSSLHREKHEESSEISQDHCNEGTAARTRPFSYDEIMARRKNKKLHEDVKEGAIRDMPRDDVVEKGFDHYGSERSNERNKDNSPGSLKHSPERHDKASSRTRVEKSSVKHDYLAKGRDRHARASETKSKTAVRTDVRTEARRNTNLKFHGSRTSDKLRANGYEKEAAAKHSRDITAKSRHMDEGRGKYERGDERKSRNGVDDIRTTKKKLDLGKWHDLETSERRERKELPKSHYEESRLKRRRSRSQEREARYRRSISLSPRASKRASFHVNEHEELSAHSLKERSGRNLPNIDRTKSTNNGSSGHYGRQGGSSSGLGGYSPRKRRTEAAVKTPSPAKHSPEKKRAKWDLAPEVVNATFSVPLPSNFQSSNQTTTSNIHGVVSAVPVASSTLKLFSGVLSSALSTKNVSVDSIQLTQASRPKRRLYVENLPASTSEKAMMEWLNNQLISSGVNHIQGTQPCISCIMHKEKCQALVEFLTPEDASAALSFDGSSFSGSIIKIRRPKDFVEVATDEPEKSAAAVNVISNTVKDSPHKIFIGGISKVLSSKMLMEIASAFGPLKAYQFENSEDLGEPYAFLEYADESVTCKACAGLNGMKLAGQVITAVQVIPTGTSLECDGNLQCHGIPEHAKSLLEKPSEVLKLKNVFDAETFSSLSHTEIEEVLEDVRLECARFGTVKCVNVVKHDASPMSPAEACEVNDFLVPAGAQQNLGCDATNSNMEALEEAVDHKILEGSSIADDKSMGDHMEDKPTAPLDGDAACEDPEFKSMSDPQEHPQLCTLKEESDFAQDTVTDDLERKDSIEENKMRAEEKLNMEKISDELEGASTDGDSVQKGLDAAENGEQKKDQSNIFEPGCILVEFRRTESSCMAAHCLHGRLFDDRMVTVGYVPLEDYQAGFPK